jgi:hypothetical protein
MILRTCVHAGCRMAAADCVLPSDILRHDEIPAGIIGLRHKSRHKSRTAATHRQPSMDVTISLASANAKSCALRKPAPEPQPEGDGVLGSRWLTHHRKIRLEAASRTLNAGRFAYHS